MTIVHAALHLPGGDASCGEDAGSLADELHPDVVVTDLRMEGISGLEATRRITARHQKIAVLVLTMLDEDAEAFAPLRAGCPRIPQRRWPR